MELGTFFADMMMDKGLVDETDIILGPSYKGSAIALATSIALYANHGRDRYFEYDRKEAKSHGEASKSVSIMVNRTLFDGCRVFIVDDVATSMGTKYELLDRLQKESVRNGFSINVTGIGIAIDREQSTAVYDKEGRVVHGEKGEDAIRHFCLKTNIPVYSVAGIREIMDFLYREEVPVLISGNRNPIDKATKKKFDDYITMYGVD